MFNVHRQSNLGTYIKRLRMKGYLVNHLCLQNFCLTSCKHNKLREPEGTISKWETDMMREGTSYQLLLISPLGGKHSVILHNYMLSLLCRIRWYEPTYRTRWGGLDLKHHLALLNCQMQICFYQFPLNVCPTFLLTSLNRDFF